MRGPCPRCGCPDAETLFRLPGCMNATCRFYDPAVTYSGPEGRRLAEWWAWTSLAPSQPSPLPITP